MREHGAVITAGAVTEDTGNPGLADAACVPPEESNPFPGEGIPIRIEAMSSFPGAKPMSARCKLVLVC